MRSVIVLAVVALLSAAACGAFDQGQEKQALPPHPLDSAFVGDSERAFHQAISNHKHYRKALEGALRAKKEQEQRLKDNPQLKDASPEQAARRAFLNDLLAGQ